MKILESKVLFLCIYFLVLKTVGKIFYFHKSNKPSDAGASYSENLFFFSSLLLFFLALWGVSGQVTKFAHCSATECEKDLKEPN